RSHGRIAAVGPSLSIQAIVGGLASIALVFPFHAWGLVYGWLLGGLVTLVYVRIQGASVAPLRFEINPGTRALLARGFPIFLFMASSQVLKSIDRIMILKYLSTEDL